MTPTYYKYKRMRAAGLSDAEIAAECGVKVATVGATISRYRNEKAAEQFRARHRQYQQTCT